MRGEFALRRGSWRSLAGTLWRALLARRSPAPFNHRARRVSSERSSQLLLACLSPAQRDEFQRSHAFRVRGCSGQWYRVCYGTAANIDVLGERGEVIHRLCAGPAGLAPPAIMLAQKLMLETREAEFLCLAARHPPPVIVSPRDFSPV